MKLKMVANGSQKPEENVQLDAAKSKESTLLTEEKLYSSDIFRMFCYKVRVLSSVSSRLLDTPPCLDGSASRASRGRGCLLGSP